MNQKIKPIKSANFREHFTQANESDMEASLVNSILWSVLLLNLYVLVATILVYLLNPSNSVIYIGSYLLLCMATLALSINTARSKLGFANGIILSLLSWLLMGMVYFVANEYLNFYHWKYEVVKNISVKEVNQYPNASAFYFNDGKILLDKHDASLFITGNSETSTGSVTSYMVPFVPNDWKENDSVQVFLFGEENNQFEYTVPIEYSDFYKELQKPYNAGLVLRVPDGEEMYAEKILDAKNHHHLNIAPNPFILKWVEDPVRHVKEFFKDCLIGLFFLNLLWIAFVIFRRLYFANKRAKRVKNLKV